MYRNPLNSVAGGGDVDSPSPKQQPRRKSCDNAGAHITVAFEPFEENSTVTHRPRIPRSPRLLITLLALPLLAAADTPPAPFTHPKPVTAWNRYQYRAGKARETYEREMAAIGAEYKAALSEAAQIVAKTGDTDELKRIVEAQERIEDVRLTSPVDVRSLVVGVRKDLSGKVEFAADGRVVRSYNPGIGTWRITPEGFVEVIFEIGTTPHWLIAIQPGSDRALCVRFRKDGTPGAGVIHTRQ